MNRIKVCHLSSAHTRYDIRIFRKECISLKNNNFEVYFVVADGKGDEITDNIKIIDAGKSKSRFDRMLKASKRVYKKALNVDADIYHFHDPELIPYGKKLLKINKKVIYDAHEDLPEQILSKPYINRFFKKIVSSIIRIYENNSAKKFSYIITATPYIRDKFFKINKNTIDINNYPLLNELSCLETSMVKKNQVCYVGGITQIRGILQVAEAMQKSDSNLILAGDFENTKLKEKVFAFNTKNNIMEAGFLNRDQVKKLLSESLAGIVTFLPEPNHVYAQPNKIFEYMSASLPVIASDFDLWKDIIEKNNCGICVNPENSDHIATAINKIISNENLSKQMGENGRKAVEEKFNWEKEKIKLIEIYNKIINSISN